MPRWAGKLRRPWRQLANHSAAQAIVSARGWSWSGPAAPFYGRCPKSSSFPWNVYSFWNYNFDKGWKHNCPASSVSVFIPLRDMDWGQGLGKKINFAKRSLQNQMSIASQVAVLRNVFLIGCLWWRLPVWLRPTPIIIIAPRSMMWPVSFTTPGSIGRMAPGAPAAAPAITTPAITGPVTHAMPRACTPRHRYWMRQKSVGYISWDQPMTKANVVWKMWNPVENAKILQNTSEFCKKFEKILKSYLKSGGFQKNIAAYLIRVAAWGWLLISLGRAWKLGQRVSWM